MSPLVTRPGNPFKAWNAANLRARIVSEQKPKRRYRLNRTRQVRQLHQLDPNGVCAECTRREGGTP